MKLCFEKRVGEHSSLRSPPLELHQKNDQEICCSLSDTAAEGAAAAMRLPAAWSGLGGVFLMFFFEMT